MSSCRSRSLQSQNISASHSRRESNLCFQMIVDFVSSGGSRNLKTMSISNTTPPRRENKARPDESRSPQFSCLDLAAAAWGGVTKVGVERRKRDWMVFFNYCYYILRLDFAHVNPQSFEDVRDEKLHSRINKAHLSVCLSVEEDASLCGGLGGAESIPPSGRRENMTKQDERGAPVTPARSPHSFFTCAIQQLRESWIPERYN